MALSQIQCLDDNHVNPRTHESKPEFLYCEEQRLALEALLRDGREAFAKHLAARGLRGFLSDLERESLSAAEEPFDPDSEVLPRDADDEGTPLSLQYWPQLSDTSAPQMDLGWPDCDSYRGVTRTSVYTQPPLDGQAHIKEVVRKMIAQAQKVIAIVMDLFTDVDIFRDLLDAGFKRKVSVYILLERTTLPHFLSMCQRANMHAGHLKHLRVCCTGGVEFYTRHCTKVPGRLGHRFMFIDGDKAVSGSYSFTWMSSRLDRNLITVITGQAVDAFDQLFRFLYMTSRAVDLRKVATEPEPEPDSRPQVVSVIVPSAAVARKLHNPKYALVALTNSSPTTSFGNGSPKEPEKSEKSKKKERRRMSEDALPLHPGLINLEKANLIPYLPIWPEPDPPSDVIGFINIRDSNKATQVHLQRSERFETSQAIKFSSPLSKPQEPLPEVATPRQITIQHNEINKLPLAQNESKTKELVVDTAVPGHNKDEDKAPEQTSSSCSQKSVPDEDNTKALKAKSKLCSNTAINPDAGRVTPDVSRDTPPQTCNETSSSNKDRPSNKAGTLSTTSPKSDLLTFSALNKPQEVLPEGVIPGQITGKHEEMNKPQPEQNEPKSNELVTDSAAPGYDKSKAKAPEQKSCRQKSELDKDNFNILKLDKKVCLNTAINPDAVYDAPGFGPNTPPYSSNKTPSSNKETSSNKAEIVSTTSSKSHSNESKPKEMMIDTAALGHNKSKDKAPDIKNPPCGQKSVPDKDETKVFKTEDKLCSNTAINLSHDTHNFSSNTLPQSSTTVPSSKKEKPSTKTEIVSTSLKSDSSESKPKDLVVATAAPGQNKSKDKAPDQKLTQCSQKSVPEQDETTILQTDNKLCLNPDVGHNKPDLSPETPPQSSKKAPLSIKERLLNKMTTVSTASPKSDSLIQSEPDLTKDASRLINTQDAIKPTQSSEVSEISQAIKFSIPLSKPQEALPEIPKPRQITVKHEELSEPQPAQNEPKAKALVVDIARPGKNEAPGQKSPQCSQKSIPDKDETKVLNSSNTALSPGAEIPLQSCSKTPPSNKERLLNQAETVSTTRLKSDSLTESEPDPTSDGKGVINSQDANKPMQIHIQHTDMSEISQALKFISSLNKLQETFPEVAAAEPITAKHEEINKVQPAQNEPKAKELVIAAPGHDKSKDKVPEQKSPPRSQKSAPDKGETKVLKTEKKLSLKSAINTNAGPNTPGLSSNTPPQSSNKAPSSSKEIPLSQVKSTSATCDQSDSNESKPKDLVVDTATRSKNKSKDKDQKSCSQKFIADNDKTKAVAMENKFYSSTTIKPAVSHNTSDLSPDTSPQSGNRAPLSNSAQTSLLQTSPQPNTGDTHVGSHAESHTASINMQPKVSSKVTQNFLIPTGLGNTHSSVSPTQSEGSTSLSNPATITVVCSSTASIPCKSHPSTSSPSFSPSFTTQPSPTSSASAVLLSLPPVPKPRTVQLVLKDRSIPNSQMLSEITRSPDSSAEVQTVHSVPPPTSVVQMSSVKRDQAVPEVQCSSPSNREAQKEQNQCASSQEKKRKEDDECHDRAGEQPVTGTKLKMKSDLLKTDALKTASANVQEIIPNDVDSKTLMSTDSKTCSGSVTTAQTEETLTNCELAKGPNLIQPQTYLVRSHEPQKILFSKFTSQDIDVSESFKAPMNDTTQSPYVLKDGIDGRIHSHAGNTLSQPGKQVQVTLKQSDTDNTCQEQTQTSTSTPEKALHFSFPLAQTATAISPIAEQTSKSAAVNARTSDAFPSRSSTPDSRTTSPDPQRYTPDFRTPVSDASDGYVSPREDSSFSNASEEFYQCCDSPLKEFVLAPSDFHNYKTRDDCTSLTYANTSSAATTTDTSPVYLNYSTTAAAGQNTSNTEVGLLSRTTGVTSSLLGINAQKSEPKEDTKANDKEEDIWVRRMNQESQGSEGTDNQEAIRMVKPGQCEDDLTETGVKGDEVQSSMQKRAPINSTADNRGGQETEPKQFSAGDLKPEEVSSEDRQEKTSSRREEARKLNTEERRGRQSTRETKGQKVFSNSSKPERVQQQGHGPPSSPRPVRSPRPLSGSLVSGARRSGSQSESRVFYSGFKVSDNTSAPRRPASRSPAPVGRGPVGAVASRKQAPHSFVSRQSAAAQMRSKADQSQTQAPMRPASYLYTHSNLQPQHSPQGPMQRGSDQAAPEQDEGRGLFNLPFSRLYGFRGLRDKWTKLPTQSKKSSTSAPGKERKSTS